MSQQSPVTITWERGPSSSVVLVTADDWMAEPLAASGQQDVLDAPGMAVAEAYFRALGGAVLDLSFALEQDEDTAADAAEKYIDLEATWVGLDGRSGTLTIEAEDASWTLVFEPCVFVEMTPALPSDTGDATLVRKLRFLAAPPAYTEP